MINKYLISIIVPTIELEFDAYIPNNKKIGTIKSNILKYISEVSNGNYTKGLDQSRFIDRETGLEYDNNVMIKDSNIKNGTKIIVM